MHSKYSLPRNSTEGFASRVRKNLAFIIDHRDNGADVHEVTQLAISLLGLVVFPWEAGALHHLEDLTLTELQSEGWPQWDITLDEKADTKTLGALVKHIRNAASHRRLRFSSDSPIMAEVQIEFEDAYPQSGKVHWRASINAAHLKDFCDRFTTRLEDLVG